MNDNNALVRQNDPALLPVAVIKDRLDQVQQLMKDAMQEKVDYGIIPGTKNPTLLKAGAEKLAMMFQIGKDFETVKTFSPDGHMMVEAKCILSRGDMLLGSANAVCTTREAKYAYRHASRTCPACGQPTIFKSKQGEEGWFCWRKKGGCGLQFPKEDPRIIGQEEGRVPNPDLADTYNTVIRIAEKRAFIAAVRLVTGCSGIFDEEQPQQEERHEETRHEEQPPEEKVDGRVMDFDMAMVSAQSVEDLSGIWKQLQAAHKKKAFSKADMATLTAIKDRVKGAFAEAVA